MQVCLYIVGIICSQRFITTAYTSLFDCIEGSSKCDPAVLLGPQFVECEKSFVELDCQVLQECCTGKSERWIRS